MLQLNWSCSFHYIYKHSERDPCPHLTTTVTKPSNPLTLHKGLTNLSSILTSTLEPDFGSFLSDDSEDESVYADSELGEAGQVRQTFV